MLAMCSWCGERHPADRLCQPAQRTLSRRSFCFLFGAGIAGALLPKAASTWVLQENDLPSRDTVFEIIRLLAPREVPLLDWLQEDQTIPLSEWTGLPVYRDASLPDNVVVERDKDGNEIARYTLPR